MLTAQQHHILVVDDEKNITFVIKAILEKAGFRVNAFNHPKQAMEELESGRTEYSVVITDLYMPEMTGMDILSELKLKNPSLPVIMITAFGTVESAVQALKCGAFDFLTKPFEQGEILSVVEKAVNTYSLRKQEPQGVTSETQLQQTIIVGKSPQMQEVLRVIQKVAASPSTVLINGESGTGKELVALELHRFSDRSDKPFIKINCAAIPHNLIESELFGYEKGAFTGAVTNKPGRFELAHEGTLFLDEIAEMPLEMQVKLLRVIQESEFERVGGLETIKINVRLICAANKDLATEVSAGRFREDLFYRLNVVPLLIPPLRDRRMDIEDLIFFFIRKFNERLHKNIESIDPLCLKALLQYRWPGNIRQLENVMERAVLMNESHILTLQDLPAEIVQESNENPQTDFEYSEALKEMQNGGSFKDIVKRQTHRVEREIIERVLRQNDGNVTRTAEKLGLSRKGLQLKLKELGVAAR